MPDVTRLLEAAAGGDRQAAADLLPLVYDELRKLAAARTAGEPDGRTLDATALVHEAYLKLVGDQQFGGRGHFFAAAAEAMRRVLADHARAAGRGERGGDRRRVPLADISGRADDDPHLFLSPDDALTRLAAEDPDAAAVAKLPEPDRETQIERSRALALLAGLGSDAKSGVTKDEAEAFADQSVAGLAGVVKTGWALPSELKEPDFDAVRGRADFRRLFAEVEAKAEKVPEPAPPPRKK